MILTTLPDLPPRPETLGNAAFRRRFYERWGRENAIVCGPACNVEFARHQQTLSIKAAWGGTGERYLLPRRDLLVDDDSYLVLDEGLRYGSVVRAPRPVTSFAVFFRPGMAEEVARARRQSLTQALDGYAVAAPAIGFRPHLRRHDTAVSPRLRRLWHAVRQGERDEDWLETELFGLLSALLDAERAIAAREPLPTARPAARRELRRRLHLAADFIDSNATQAIDLERMAEVACLSKYHFVREFGRLFGCTPRDWLTRKRVGIARRLIAQGETDPERAAQASGLGSRWALRRAMARWPEAA
ncbi:MAG TPA: helix-turn-helix domain-containing protein [Aquabacterium sp.]|nr:helix-turn-helix domain-containing protein [Aquabacterium sp.]